MEKQHPARYYVTMIPCGVYCNYPVTFALLFLLSALAGLVHEHADKRFTRDADAV